MQRRANDASGVAHELKSGSRMETHRPPLLERLLIALAVPLLCALGSTLRARELGRVDWSLRSSRDPGALWSLWHETLLPGIWFYRRREIRVMISASRDGERIARITQRLGYQPVRGSTSKGSLAATRKLVAGLREGHRTAITPDGPRGPRRCAQPGVVAVARLSGRPVVAIGIGPERCWRLPSWDRFAIPKPFSRLHYAYGDPIWVPREGGSDADYLAQIQREMDRVTEIAEAAARGAER
jgi:lysophospholipid acyltransferase (LPLAT)-like uncharacterized protein